jgi:hypothetical protein
MAKKNFNFFKKIKKIAKFYQIFKIIIKIIIKKNFYKKNFIDKKIFFLQWNSRN